jgi:hypothetical protein
MKRLCVGASLASICLAAFLMISNNALAQSTPRDPAACTENCSKEHDRCLSQMGTPEMCSVDRKICSKECNTQ